jgi:hypothetical protein
LVEFWWNDPGNATLTADVNVYEPIAAGRRKHHGALTISPGTVGTALSFTPAGLPSGMASQSLFYAKCRKNLSCLAFALDTTSTFLPLLEIQFELESTSDVIVNAWIAVCETEPQTAFIEGGPDGTIVVPASAPDILSVAGSEASGQLWKGSSRGPAAHYQSGASPSPVPLMAHLASLAGTGEAGTSFSSPRACGDVVVALADSAKRPRCKTARDLVREAYNLNSLPAWKARSRYHMMTS